MNEHLETLIRIKEVAEEEKLMDEKMKDWRKAFSHHECPDCSVYAAAVGELRVKLEYIGMLCELGEPLPVAMHFATEFELELGKRQRLDPQCCTWYTGGDIIVETIGDNGDDDKGFELVELRPSRSGVQKSVIADIGIMRTDGNWRVVNNENTPVDAEQLIDWLEYRQSVDEARDL